METPMKKRNSPYDFKYVMIRDNCSEEQAKQTVQQHKNKTSGSKEAFIKRYGMDEGLIRFNAFSEKSAHTKESFRKKYGDNWENEWDRYLKSKDSMSEEFHKKKYGDNWEFEFNKRKNAVLNTLERMIERHGDGGSVKYKEMNKKRSKSCSTDGLIEKYGEQMAQEINKSKALPGSKNGMYGKPPLKSSGYGWSGWYNGYHFRSLLELSYIKFLIDADIKFKSAETKEYMVEYMLEGIERTYWPDFVVDGDIIEIKPSRLVNTKQNTAKFKAAKEKYGTKFKILTENDFPVIKDITDLVESGKIKLLKKYQKICNERKRKYIAI